MMLTFCKLFCQCVFNVVQIFKTLTHIRCYVAIQLSFQTFTKHVKSFDAYVLVKKPDLTGMRQYVWPCARAGLSLEFHRYKEMHKHKYCFPLFLVQRSKCIMHLTNIHALRCEANMQLGKAESICIIILMHPAKMFLTHDLIKVFFFNHNGCSIQDLCSCCYRPITITIQSLLMITVATSDVLLT